MIIKMAPFFIRYGNELFDLFTAVFFLLFFLSFYVSIGSLVVLISCKPCCI